MPLFYLDVYEMREILKAQGRLADDLRDSTERIIRNNFILLADEPTVKEWENILNITYDVPMTLDQRKNVIIGHICGYAHIGEPEIREIIALYTDFSVTVAFAKGVITITIDGIGSILGFSNLVETLLKRIPAHLALRFSVNIRAAKPAVLRVGGNIGLAARISVPQGADSFDFRNTLNFGGASEIRSSVGIPEDTRIPNTHSILHTGGTGGMRACSGVPEDTALPKVRSVLRTGGKLAARSSLSLPEDTAPPPSQSEMQTGAASSQFSSLAIPENTAPPPAISIQRIGTVCNIISNLSQGE